MGGYHHQLISETGIFDIVGVYDIASAPSLKAEELGIKSYSSLEELLSNDKIDIILIATPNDDHHDIAISAMKAKKHVICEKPVAMNLKELESMIECSKENNVIFTVNQNRRFDTDFLTVKKLYSDRTIGDIFHIDSRVYGSRGIPGDWRGEFKHGGGMMFDWGIHLLDQMLLLTDVKIKSVYCTFSHVTNEEVDDGFRANLTYEDGMTASIEVGTCQFIEIPRWYVSGNNGSAMLEPWREVGQLVVLENWNEKDVKPIKAASGFTKTMAPRADEESTVNTNVDFVPGDPKVVYYNLDKAIDGTEELLISQESLVRTFKLIEMCFKSAKENIVIETEGKL